MKNKCESCGRSKSRTFTAVTLLSVFESNKTHLALEMNSTNKFAIVNRSNNVGFWGRSPQPPGVNGGSGAEHPMLR